MSGQHQPNASKAHFYLNASAKQNNGGMVKVSPDMTFEQAQGLIHAHIMSLDI